MPQLRYGGSSGDVADAAATVGLVVTGALIGITHGVARVAWLAGAVALTAIQVGLTTRRRVLARRAARDAGQLAEDIRTSTNYAISDAFVPLLRLVTELFEASDETSRETLRRQIATSVLYAAVGSLGPEHGVRACFFVLDLDPGPADGDGTEATPVALRWSGLVAGRFDEPRSPFLAGTESGDAAIAMVQDDGYLFCHDIETDPPPGWDAHEHVYRTFLAVPVRGADLATGMLTVDALHPGDLQAERDRPVLTVLARILAISQLAGP